jgi:hypothetical protein
LVSLRPKADACYRREPMPEGDLYSGVRVQLFIACDGTPSRIDIESHGLAESGTACILSVMRAARFPRPEGGSAVIQYPLRDPRQR